MAANAKLEIRQAVIRTITVLVVDGLIVVKFPPEFLRHDKAVLEHVCVTDPYPDVAIRP